MELLVILHISIHALREEGDLPGLFLTLLILLFLSTPSARRATLSQGRFLAEESISIHALREEGDRVRSSQHRAAQNFYPRPPRGGRPACRSFSGRLSNFYPRPPRGGRLHPQGQANSLRVFLSTPSARRATRRPRCRCRPAANFYPRPPRGGRLRILNNFNNVELFLSTPSARRATHRIQVQLRQLPISIHALREEGDPLQILGPGLQIQFLSTPSARRATPTSTAPAPGTSNFYPRPPRGGRLF